MAPPARRSPCTFTDELGSVMLISIVLVFVMTLLGLALFELGAIENRMSLSSAADAPPRGAQGDRAGPPRTQDGFDVPHGSESWVNDGAAPHLRSSGARSRR
jgi:hypothetical protein